MADSFQKILIANRGEIALRIIRACWELDIPTVAVYSQADAESLHVRFADEAVCIGPGPSNQSYLDQKRILAAAEVSGADAVHPGYGFLAENADFAEVCDESGLTFIGPSAEAINRMGNKAQAKATMIAAGVPVTPGSDGVVRSLDEARNIADRIGYPVILKASAGGGGKGMRVVRSEAGLESSYELAKAEAEAAFSNSDLYLEKYIENPRHVEVQIMGDAHGNVLHFGERDCSLQRRHQKLVEESPCPVVTDKLREQMGDAAVKAAQAVKYVGAGTVEFLLTPDGNFYFMEMNTRIQVEHPVTEEVTGVDLLKLMIRVAQGEAIPMKQEDVEIRGHAIEFRINAEDPDKNFLPAPGTLQTFHMPGGRGVRVDSHAYNGYRIPPFYDSMIAKLIVHGETREEALQRGRRALEEFIIEGIPTTIPLHKNILSTDEFRAGKVDTGFLERWMNARRKPRTL
ncbi:acetyl-CoA carboxylase biotin carboxylase subunit [bacterium]|nr:acetyl-CoA carboxylase biotin carboxylase subunit [bacterium]